MTEPAHQFRTGTPFSIGLEEELFLVDPATGHQTNSSRAVLDRIDQENAQLAGGKIERELHACQVELITGIHTSAAEAAQALGDLRSAVVETGAGLLGAGTHPSAEAGDAEITDKERYERIHYLLGDAVLTPVGGLHIHIGMPDPETAIRVFNGLRRHLPLLQALAANSPFRHGRDTGLASAREVTMRAWPRSGVPRALLDFADFVEMSKVVTRAAGVPDYTWFWWKVRPHPRLGTVEIRTLDAQTSLADTAALAAFVHCLARWEASRVPDASEGSELLPEVLEEGIFRAARFGVDAELVDGEYGHRSVSETVDSLIEKLGEHAGELGCTAELARLPELVRHGGGAGRQRAIYEIAGIDAVTRELTRITSDAPYGLDPQAGTS
ncbi:MAG TPA: YbdK family carboxylate-amine ligase [Solirubrobacteraceae bacterium]|jgi:carboxylate-amine ligase|nr:YbdK family carboxylate-amine ligase [Solirubrobacteraceae bacterium]